VLFYDILKRDKIRFEALLNTSRVVVTPYSNKLELGTQLTVIFFVWMLLTLFFSRKIELFAVLQDCKHRERPFATIDCANILGSLYRGRKHLHYLIAAFSATLATCIHFYYIGDSHSRIAQPISELVGLSAYDYRLATELTPIFITHWLLQFLIIFMFVLSAWNVGILGRCVQRFQRHIAYVKAAEANGLQSAASATNQRIARWALTGVAIVILCSFGWFKLEEADVGGLLDWSGQQGIFQLAYFFGPAYSAAGFLWFATPQMYSNFNLTGRPRRKWTKEDVDYIEAALGKVPQLLTMIKTIQDIIHAARA
jgi:hypothetical protein